MAINFAAESMQGYNNPELAIITVRVNSGGEFIDPPTFEDISNILKRGVVPFLATPYFMGSTLLPLSYYSNDSLTFSGVVQTPNDPLDTMKLLSVSFNPGIDPVLSLIPVTTPK